MRQKHSSIGVLLSVLLGLTFALCALFVTLFGADVYASVLDDSSQNDITRTATLYIANKVRQHDADDSISIRSIEGNVALVLEQQVEGETILTYLYLYDGELNEVSVLDGSPVAKSAGQPVLPLSKLSFSYVNPALLRVSLADEKGHAADFLLHIRTYEVTP